MDLIKLKKQKKLITIIYIAVLVFIVGFFTLITVYMQDSIFGRFIFFGILVVLFFTSLYFKPKIEYINNKYYLLLLLNEDLTPTKYKQNITYSSWPQKVLTKGKYLRLDDNKDYLSLYKTVKDPYKPKRKKHQLLELIYFNRHSDSFISSTEMFNLNKTLVEKHLKEYSHKRVVALQFSETNEFTSEVNDKIKDINYLKIGRTYYLTVNILINPKEKQALYVNGENKMYIFYFNYVLRLLDNYLN